MFGKMEILNLIEDSSSKLNKLVGSAEVLIKAKYNKRYVKLFGEDKLNFRKSIKLLELELHRLAKFEEEKKISETLAFLDDAKKGAKDILTFLEEFQKVLIDLEVAATSFDRSSFEVPPEIPIGEIRSDLEEAIKDYDNGCFASSQIMCRRAYEGALREKYKEIEGKEPKEDFNCPYCKKRIRKDVEMSVTKLHKWAVEKKVIHEKLQNVGFLIPELAAGAAHPNQNPFPRDKQIAKLTIEATFALIIQIYKKKLTLLTSI